MISSYSVSHIQRWFHDTWVHATSSEGSDTNHFKLFFTRNATNNPEGIFPNWYYYWSQTSAAYGTHNFDSNLWDSGFTDLYGGVWKTYIGQYANRSAAAGTWNQAEGIDFFAHICRHEERHRQDMNSLWGSYYDPTNDPDGDRLPTDNGTVTEYSLGVPYHSGGYDYRQRATVIDHFFYGAGWKDSEDYCMHREAPWTNGSADTVDWANPGHQY